MTPALKAMVEAMIAEIRRQNVLDATASDPPTTATVVFVNGVVNLEKVARAGLEATKEPGDAVRRAADETCPLRADEPPFPYMIDAILKEQP